MTAGIPALVTPGSVDGATPFLQGLASAFVSYILATPIIRKAGDHSTLSHLAPHCILARAGCSLDLTDINPGMESPCDLPKVTQPRAELGQQSGIDSETQVFSLNSMRVLHTTLNFGLYCSE